MHAEAAPSEQPHRPYPCEDELIDDQVAAIAYRIKSATDQLSSRTRMERQPGASTELRALESRIEARIVATEAALPILRVRERFGLTATEHRVLWLLLAHELCPITRDELRRLASDDSLDPTTDVIRRVIYGRGSSPTMWRELGPDGTLRRYALIEPAQPEGERFDQRQPWRVSRRVLALLHGDLAVDTELASIATVLTTPSSIEQLELATGTRERIDAGFEGGDLVIVHGRVGSGRRSSLAAIARRRGLEVLCVEARALALDPGTARDQLRAIARECRLLGLVPLLRDLDALVANGERQDRIELVERELTGLVLGTSAAPIARRWQRTPITVELGELSSIQRAALWGRALPAAGDGDAEILATLYPLAPSLIEAAGRLSTQRCGDQPMRPEHIQDALRSLLDDRLAGLARRVEITQTWDDIVLPEDQTTAMTELLSRIRERARVYEQWGFADKLGKGLGICALFSGPPGTGKTMAAGLLARGLGLELYQVDLSKIVSKMIGETEKNLAALFDAAEAGQAILLFDEADALFGKRTEVRNSNDRHANQEINFLLQRLESYAGICILTTNHETAIDEAFRRRLTIHVRFPLPDEDERARLWRAMIPKQAPCADELGIEALASTYVMSGGYIRNAVLRAAFLAADEGGTIDASRLLRAARLEYEAMGKLVSR